MIALWSGTRTVSQLQVTGLEASQGWNVGSTCGSQFPSCSTCTITVRRTTDAGASSSKATFKLHGTDPAWSTAAREP